MKKIPMLERFAAQSLVEYDGELIFSKEKFAELIVRECADICRYHPSRIVSNNWVGHDVAQDIVQQFEEHFGVEEK